MADWTMINAVNNTGADDERVFMTKATGKKQFQIVYRNGDDFIGAVLAEGVTVCPIGTISEDRMHDEMTDIDEVAFAAIINGKERLVIIDSTGMSTVDGSFDDVVESLEEIDAFEPNVGWEGVQALYD